MILSPGTVNLIVSIILFFFASIVSVVFSGAVQARVALWMGDDTSERMGYTSLNPFAHITEYNIIFFVAFGLLFNLWIMLGQWQLINVNNIKDSYRIIRLACVYSACFIMNIFLAIMSLIMTVVLLGPVSFPISHSVFGKGLVPFHEFAQFFPESSTLFIIVTLFFVALLFVNVISGMLNFVLGFVRWFIGVMGWDQDPTRFWTVFMVSLIVPFMLLWLFEGYLLQALMYVVDNTALGFMHLFGLDRFDASSVAKLMQFLNK